jgi:hypothetical protein
MSSDNKEKLYFRVYQDKVSTNEDDLYYIDTVENVMNMCNSSDFKDECFDDLPPIFEPIFMNEKEFNNLPEFNGY